MARAPHRRQDPQQLCHDRVRHRLFRVSLGAPRFCFGLRLSWSHHRFGSTTTGRENEALTPPPSRSATNIRTSIVLDEKTNEIVVNGHKWWISGAGDPRNEIHIVMGKS